MARPWTLYPRLSAYISLSTHPRLGLCFPSPPEPCRGKRCTMLRPRLRIPATTRSFSRQIATHRPLYYPPPRTCYTSSHPSSCWGRKLGSSYRTFLKAELSKPTILPAIAVGGYRKFHSTPRNQYSPILGLLVGVLKTSTALEMARTAARVALTFIPVLLIKNHKSKRFLAVAEARGHHLDDDRKDVLLKNIRYRTMIFHFLLVAPIILFWATLLASIERTPLTGRLRLILLSPEEEEDIASQLAGPGWYHAVGEILAKDGPPRLIPPSDWRLAWVEDTLRRLESVIPSLQRENELEPRWLACGPDDIPFPPPADYPLQPRPRASEYIRRFAEMASARTVQPAPHVIPGPPYSLIVVDRPESSNAFSYGFGPDGGGGIVVFSGFLDEVLSKHRAQVMNVEAHAPPPPEKSWIQSILGGLLPSSSPPPPTHPVPTDEQTSELAILLAHELAHLILSHHLETLSSGSVLGPGLMSMVTDFVRALLFPVTMLFGPFINDALAGLGKISSGEFSQLAEYCTNKTQEIEADIVSARLLAHAGFDPRHAVQFWEERGNTEQNAECAPSTAKELFEAHGNSIPLRWIGNSHPISIDRVAKLKEELVTWEARREVERQKVLAAQKEQEKQPQR